MPGRAKEGCLKYRLRAAFHRGNGGRGPFFQRAGGRDLDQSAVRFEKLAIGFLVLQARLLGQYIQITVGCLVRRSIGIDCLQQMKRRGMAATEKTDQIGRRVKQRAIVNVQNCPLSDDLRKVISYKYVRFGRCLSI